MLVLLVCLLVGAVLGMGLNVVSLLPATLIAIVAILASDLVQSTLSFSSLQACLIAAFALQIGYASGICVRYLLKTPPRAPVAVTTSVGERKKSYVEAA
jgi:hypothetical protein